MLLYTIVSSRHSTITPYMEPACLIKVNKSVLIHSTISILIISVNATIAKLLTISILIIFAGHMSLSCYKLQLLVSGGLC